MFDHLCEQCAHHKSHVCLTIGEAKIICDLLMQLSCLTPKAQRSWDILDRLSMSSISACTKLMKAAGHEVPDNLKMK